MRQRDVLVIGGGPAGSTAAAALARKGLDVMLLEAGEHPRAHVGESLLPGIIPILQRTGALPKIEAAGFRPKTGSTHWNWGTTPRWDLWFCDGDAYDHAWIVERAKFDAVLFEHASACGADVRTRCSAREVLFAGDRAEAVRWRQRGDDADTTTRARWIIDATGQSGLLCRRIGPPVPIAGLKHQAMWAHFERAGTLPHPRQHQALFFAEDTQWWWCFGLGEGRASVGVVQLDSQGRQGAPRRDFDALLAAAAPIRDVLGPDARRCTDVRRERDWSYRCPQVAGPGWFAVGDAAGFIDPVLSTGVMLAVHSAYHAATSIADLYHGVVASEAEASSHYCDHHAQMFDDLMRIVRFFYQQNLSRDDYFWESKRILAPAQPDRLRPQKAFLLLTSGLIGNLALQDVADRTSQRRVERTLGTGCGVGADARRLDFICVHLRRHDPELSPPMLSVPIEGASVYVLIEPADPADPTLFRTRNFHFNAVAPRYGNDPISNPAIEPVLRRLHALVDELDAVDGTTLATWWRDHGHRLAEAVAQLPSGWTLQRIFGQ